MHSITLCFLFLLSILFQTADAGTGVGTPVQVDSLSLHRYTELLSRYLQIESLSGNERRAGEFIQQVADSAGLFTHRLTDIDSAFNLSVSLYPLEEGKPNIIFISHLDVVPAGLDEEWTHPPFSGFNDGEKIWGRGVLDAKGLGIIQLASLLEFRKKSLSAVLPFNVSVLFLSGEELGGFNGAALVTDECIPLLNPEVVYGEGGSGFTRTIHSNPYKQIFGVSVAEKKSLWLQLEIKYFTFGHGAAPPENYANKLMLKALNRITNTKTKLIFNSTNKRMFRRLGEIEGGVKGFVLKHIHWAIFRPFVRSYFRREPVLSSLVSNTIVVTNITNPYGPPNKIANKVTATLDCRLLPGTKQNRFIRDLKAAFLIPKIEVDILIQSPEAEETAPGVYYDLLSKAIHIHHPKSEVIPILFPATTDNNYFRSKDVQVYGLIPTIFSDEQIRAVHNINEYLEISKIKSGIEVMTETLELIKKEKYSIR